MTHTRHSLSARTYQIIAFLVGMLLAITVLTTVFHLRSPAPTTLNGATSPFVEMAPYTLVELPTASTSPSSSTPTLLNSTTTELSYIEVIDGCGPYFDTTECLNVRSGPGTEFPVVATLRNGIVLRTTDTITADGTTWYKVVFDEWVRYPERVAPAWYVAAQYVRPFTDVGPLALDPLATPTTSKRILVERSSQTLTAFEGETIVMTATTSTGRDAFPTPRGTFTIFKKTPSRYMQGPLPNIPGSLYYDLPGVPWNLYFTEQGAVIHGAYWHDSFGTQYSHGCVNLTPALAEQLYHWADVGTTVVVRD